MTVGDVTAAFRTAVERSFHSFIDAIRPTTAHTSMAVLAARPSWNNLPPLVLNPKRRSLTKRFLLLCLELLSQLSVLFAEQIAFTLKLLFLFPQTLELFTKTIDLSLLYPLLSLVVRAQTWRHRSQRSTLVDPLPQPIEIAAGFAPLARGAIEIALNTYIMSADESSVGAGGESVARLSPGEAEPKVRPEAHLDEWVAPDIGDERGYLRAGKVFEWMDVVGVLAATRHCRRPVATASVDGIELREPIRVGERVTMTAVVGHTSRASIGVSVSMTHGPPKAGTRRSLAGHMTFVALDDEGRAMPVPQLQPESPAEVARFREGQLRREFRKKLLAGELPALPSPASLSAQPDRALFVRELLKLFPRSFQLPFDRVDPLKPRQRHLSYVHKIEPIRSSKLNFHGTLYGGTLMRWIESSANLSARAYLDGAPVLFTGLHGLTFIRPVQPHVFVHIRSAVAHTSQDCLTVLVNVHAENPLAGHQHETLRAFLTYSPVDAANARVPPLECIGSEEKALFEEVEHRLALQRSLGDSGTG